MKAKLLTILFFTSTFFTLNAQNLVAYYPFNGDANDKSGNANNGNVYGATLTTDRFGNANSAYSFDGNNDYILCNTQVGPFGNDSRTVSFWAKTDVEPNSTSQQNSILSYGQWPTGGGRFEVLLNPKCRGLGVDVSTNYITNEFDNSDNDWHFYTVVFDNTISNALSDLKFYGDGELLTSVCNTNGDININTLDVEVLNIGRLFYSGQPRYFKGSIDEIKIYNKALTIEEINNEYQGLIAYYPFNGNANDESGNGNNGTVNGAALTTDRFGNTNSAYYFDGTSNYISIANNPNINIQTGESFTISFWLKHAAQNNAKYMFSKYKGTSGEPSFAIGTGSLGDSYSWYEFSPGGTENRGSIDLNDNEWHLITSVFKSGESITTYIDGELDVKHTITHAGSIINSRDVTIGCGSNLAQFYNGSIDDIKIYKKALTPEEIKNEFRNLVAYYPFNGTAEDKSGNGHDGTLVGPVLTTDKDGNADSAYYFDGVDDYIDLGDWENGGPMSFTFWARWDALNYYSRIIDLGNGPLSNNIIVANYEYDDKLLFSTYNDASETIMFKSAITLNQWDFYTTTVDDTGIMTTYKNGQEIQKITGYTPYVLLRTEQFIGKSNFSADGYFKGAIDELRIYQTTLSDAEILNLYTYNTLKVDKIENISASTFYVFNNTLYFKNTQNLSEIKSVEVYNLLGQNVFKTSEIEKEISLEQLQQGIHILKVGDTKGNYQTLKILKN